MTEPLLTVRNLSVTYSGDDGDVRAVRNVSFTLGRERLGIVGESGSGKSTTGRAIMGLVGPSARIEADELRLGDTELRGLSEHIVGRPIVTPKYQRPVVPADERRAGELLTVALRYQRPEGGPSRRIEAVVEADAAPLGPNLGFASAVAELGLLLTRSAHAGTANVDRLIERARAFTGEDPYEDRAGFVTLAERAAGLMRDARPDPSPEARR